MQNSNEAGEHGMSLRLGENVGDIDIARDMDHYTVNESETELSEEVGCTRVRRGPHLRQ